MKILITGEAGLLGSRVAKLARDRHTALGTYLGPAPNIEGVDEFELDITKREDVFTAVREKEPDVIIHTAAMTDVDACEREPEKAMLVNGQGTENLAMAARESGARMIYVSTDYVFDGERKDSSYFEYEAVNPVSHYGRSKLRGEVGVKICNGWAVARVSVLYGWNNKMQHSNFVTWAIEKLRKGEKISLLTDQFTSPTLLENCAEALLKMAETRVTGTYHACGSTCIDRYEFGLQIAEKFGLDKGLISQNTSDKIKWLAKRPMRACLSVKKMEEDLGVHMMTTEEGLTFMKSQLEKGEAEGWTL